MKAVSLDFVESRPDCFQFEIDVKSGPDKAFNAFNELEKWLPKFKSMHWIKGKESVDSERFLHVDQMKVNQTILAWQPGRRFAFTVTSCNIPLMSSFMEDVSFEKNGEGSKVRWNIYYTPSFFMKVFHLPLKAYFQMFFQNEVRALEAYLNA